MFVFQTVLLASVHLTCCLSCVQHFDTYPVANSFLRTTTPLRSTSTTLAYLVTEPQIGPPNAPFWPSQRCGHSALYNSGESPESLYNAASSLRISQTGGFSKIVGGSTADPCEFPWLVRLFVIVRDGSTLQCAGSIIGNRWILTSATCFRDVFYVSGSTVGRITVAAGDPNCPISLSKSTSKCPMNLTLNAVPYMHPKYNWQNRDFDYALVRVSPAIPFNSWCYQPICLPPAGKNCSAALNCISGLNASGNKYNTTLWGVVAGFGLTVASSPTSIIPLSQSPKKAYLPIVRSSVCIRVMVKSDFNYTAAGLLFTDKTVCAGYYQGGLDACVGDMGAPLMCIVQGRYWIGAVASWTNGCGQGINVYSLYSSVCTVRDWIDSTVQAGNQDLAYQGR